MRVYTSAIVFSLLLLGFAGKSQGCEVTSVASDTMQQSRVTQVGIAAQPMTLDTSPHRGSGR